jgi:hypothetical protein
MLNRSANSATYAGDMARVGFDLPDDLLTHVDDYAHRAGEPRDQFLRRIVEEEIDRCHGELRRELEGLLDGVELDLGGKSAAEWIRDDRDHRDDKRFGPDGHAR